MVEEGFWVCGLKGRDMCVGRGWFGRLWEFLVPADEQMQVDSEAQSLCTYAVDYYCDVEG